MEIPENGTRAEGGVVMEVRLEEPEGTEEESGGLYPLWECPKCMLMKRIEDFGLRCIDREDPLWIRQSWCRSCR